MHMNMTVTTDSRGRATLGKKGETYRVSELEGGALLLEPVVTLTRAELALLDSPELLAQVRHSMAHPEQARTPRPRFTRPQD